MNIARRLSVLALALAAGSLAAPAWGSPPEVVRSTSERIATSPLSPARIVGNVVHFDFEETVRITGAFTSTELAVARFQCVAVSDEFFSCHGEQLFTGTIEGVVGEGTITNRINFKCSLSTFTCTGTVTGTDATGALSGVHAHATLEADLVTGIANVTTRLVRP